MGVFSRMKLKLQIQANFQVTIFPNVVETSNRINVNRLRLLLVYMYIILNSKYSLSNDLMSCVHVAVM